MTTTSRQLKLRATTSPVTSNIDKHLMLQAAEQIEHLQNVLKACQQEREHWNREAVQ